MVRSGESINEWLVPFFSRILLTFHFILCLFYSLRTNELTNMAEIQQIQPSQDTHAYMACTLEAGDRVVIAFGTCCMDPVHPKLCIRSFVRYLLVGSWLCISMNSKYRVPFRIYYSFDSWTFEAIYCCAHFGRLTLVYSFLLPYCILSYPISATATFNFDVVQYYMCWNEFINVFIDWNTGTTNY